MLTECTVYVPQFWVYMLLAYAVAGMLWLVLAFINWRDLLHLQVRLLHPAEQLHITAAITGSG